MKLNKIMLAALAVLSVFFCAAPAAEANDYVIYGVEITGYDPEADYLSLMEECKAAGTDYAITVGKIYERQRNLKIDELNLPYEKTYDYFDKTDEPGMKYIGKFSITGYDSCSSCCGVWAGGPTASGVMPTVNNTVAMSSEYAFGTKIYIDGLGYFTVEDRGVGRGAIDVYCKNHEECYAITGSYDVYIVG